MVFFATVGVLKGTVVTGWISHDAAATESGETLPINISK
jgi:hypothetical protein